MELEPKYGCKCGYLVVVTFLFFIASSQATWAVSGELDQILTTVTEATSSAQVIIFAEDHNTKALPTLVLESAKAIHAKNPLDCLLFELSTDLQPQLDRFASDGDTLKFLRALFVSVNPYQQKALERIFIDEKNKKRELQKIFSRQTDQQLMEKGATLPFSRELVLWAKQNGIKLVADDVRLESPEFADSIFFGLFAEFSWGDFLRSFIRKDYFSLIYRRNRVIAQNITSAYKNKSCHHSITVIGSDHVFSNMGVIINTAEDSDYQSLGYLLEQQGISTATLLIRNMGSSHPSLKPNFFKRHVLLEDYDNPVGILLY